VLEGDKVQLVCSESGLVGWWGICVTDDGYIERLSRRMDHRWADHGHSLVISGVQRNDTGLYYCHDRRDPSTRTILSTHLLIVNGT